MGRSLFAFHIRISGDLARVAWSMPPRRVDPRAFETVTRHVAAAFISSRVLMVVRAALLKAQPHPSITSRRSDAYHGQIGNELGNVIDIAPAFAIRRAIRDSAMACCRRLLCANVIKFGGIRPTWVRAYARHSRISAGDISRGVWRSGMHFAAAFGAKSVFVVSQVEARPQPWIKSHRADAKRITSQKPLSSMGSFLG
jgi:hypothetical protein